MTNVQDPVDSDATDAELDEEEGDAWLLGPDEWPTTVEAAVARIRAELSDESRQALRDMKRDELWQLHFGLAQWIRNAFGLWRGNDELLVATGRYFDADGASNLIVRKVWEALQEDISGLGQSDHRGPAAGRARATGSRIAPA